MKPGTFLGGLAAVLFSLSLVANFMTLAQLRHVTEVIENSGRSGTPVRSGKTATRTVTVEDPRMESVLEELSALRREVGGQSGILAAVSESGSESDRTRSAPVATAAPIDPEVETVLAAQSDFRKFWRDLEAVFDAQDKLEAEKYQQTVFDATLEFLGIAEPNRSIFLRESEIAVGEMAAARRYYSDARKQMPSRSQVSKEVYDSQRKAIRDRYEDQKRGAVERVTRLLSSSSHRHQEFSRRTEKWLREMTP